MIRNAVILLALCLLTGMQCRSQNQEKMNAETIKLPAPRLIGKTSLEEIMQKRRSVRSYRNEPMRLEDVSQLLWSAYGVTEPRDKPPHIRGGLKTAPSAGARYPLEVYLIAGNVQGLAQGFYRYLPESHSLVLVATGDLRVKACEAARNQKMVEEAPVSLVYTADFERTTSRYGERGKNYVYVDLGHSAQNVYLQAEALGMHSCAIGAFDDKDLHAVLSLPANESVIYMMPVGLKK